MMVTMMLIVIVMMVMNTEHDEEDGGLNRGYDMWGSESVRPSQTKSLSIDSV